MTLDTQKIIDEMSWKICPKVKEWSNVKGDRNYKCKNCPAIIKTEYGDATQFCRKIAQDVAEVALSTLQDEMPEIRNTYLNEAEPKCMEITGDTARGNWNNLKTLGR